MATHKIGKFKYSLSRDGFAWRWGDGEIKRVPFGAKKADGEGDQYTDYEDTYPDDGYADGAGDASQYDDDQYDDSQYDDGQYDDDQYDDGQYDDDQYDDGQYDDSYADESGAYADSDEYYDDYAEEEVSPILRYVEENDWVTYLLLVLLPPLGIYLLWRRNRFDMLVRSGITAASALWFVAIIVLLIMGLGGSSGPNKDLDVLHLTTVTPSPTVGLSTATPAPTATPAVQPSAVAPSATPIGMVPGDTQNGTETTGYVYSPATSIYYHASGTCANIPSGVSVSRVTVATAQNRGQSPCSLCYNAETFYATSNGKYYHKDRNCSGMENAVEYTRVAAEREGKTECPVCIKGERKSLDQTYSSDAIQQFARKISNDQSGIMVWATSGGKYYHTNSTCSGMSGASNITLLTALQAGKSNCPKCCSAGGVMVWATPGGTYYHLKSGCSSMQGASQIPLALALTMGKSNCPTCLSALNGAFDGGEGGENPGTGGSSSDVYVYATTNGKYYHVNSNCSGMSGASHITLSTALQAGKEACPVCCATANTTVYATQGGKYFHSYATCSGMSGASAGTLAQALAMGYQACPECWMHGGDNGGGNNANNGDNGASGVTVYCTRSGNYYHTNSTCSGMSGASSVSLEAAISAGKKACPVCAAVAGREVYATQGGKYFHYDSTCSGMTNAVSGTLADALIYGYAPCPVCVSGGSGNGQTTPVARFTPGTSGIKVYATQTGPYYHTSKSHAGSGASYITLETALNYGKTACPSCASIASATVYAVQGSPYFHATSAHAGSGAVAGTMADALAYGLTPCPTCLAVALGQSPVPTSPPASSNIFESGKSGIRVYATLDGRYFHTTQSHAGSGAAHITLETALNYGKSPCPDCAGMAYMTVYATGSDPYYHLYKAHAGSGAYSGYLAIAEALGKKPCEQCIAVYTGLGGGGNSGGGGTGGGSIPEYVYIDLQGDSDPYLCHSAAQCAGAGMLSGSKVSTEFAKDQGFTLCPYCFG